MKLTEIIVEKKSNLLEVLKQKLPFFSSYQIESIIELDDIKINGKKIKSYCRENLIKYKNIELSVGDNIKVYYSEEMFNKVFNKSWYSEIYKDENVLIINKRSGIEVISETDRDLLSILNSSYGEVYAVHRIDRNTEGLVIFALNENAKQELEKSFKERTIVKKYLLKVEGKVNLAQIKEKVYLKKMPDLSKVFISDVMSTGYEKIFTKFNLLKCNEKYSFLEAELFTGKTHQIRAHIAYYGWPIVGDDKYGSREKTNMCLTSYFLKFQFPKNSILQYLNEKEFSINPTWN